MISTVLIGIDQKEASTDKLSLLLAKYFPQIKICAKLDSYVKADFLIQNTNPELLFIDSELVQGYDSEILKTDSLNSFETIYTTRTPSLSIKDINYRAIGYLLLPLEQEQFISCVNKALSRIREKKELLTSIKLANEYKRLSKEDIIGIPTIEGFEFIPIKNIIRCEGLRRYTSVITTDKSDIISSYNIGKFINMLEPYSFFSPHKSHLINLTYVRKYYREGSLILTDGSRVPVSKRRKCKFLQCIKHL